MNPERNYFSDDIIEVIAPSLSGIVTFWADHTTYLTALKSDELVVKNNKNQITYYAISNGFAEFSHNTLNILVGSFEKAQDIDIKKAQERKKEAKIILKNNRDQMQDATLLTILEKEITRIRVAGKIPH